ncbi:MAG: hypothetical protein PW734_01315 [Verrucomicrobium sp.]|nr:hypothetical protein [Verrucomicrobium sp.]
MAKEILFICTGNYYRSRFAEAMFNHGAEARNLPWRAFSRGLAIHLVQDALSPHTHKALHARQVPLRHTAPDRQSLTESDLKRAARTIALKRVEHLPMMQEQFPDWSAKINYWEVHDIDFISPEEALPQIETLVSSLLDELEKGK